MAPRKKSKKENGNGKSKNGNGKDKRSVPEYSEHQLRSAIEEYRTNQISIRAVAKKYCIPVTTLYCKAKGARPIERKMGPKTILSPAVGFPIRKQVFPWNQEKKTFIS